MLEKDRGYDDEILDHESGQECVRKDNVLGDKGHSQGTDSHVNRLLQSRHEIRKKEKKDSQSDKEVEHGRRDSGFGEDNHQDIKENSKEGQGAHVSRLIASRENQHTGKII